MDNSWDLSLRCSDKNDQRPILSPLLLHPQIVIYQPSLKWSELSFLWKDERTTAKQAKV